MFWDVVAPVYCVLKPFNATWSYQKQDSGKSSEDTSQAIQSLQKNS